MAVVQNALLKLSGSQPNLWDDSEAIFPSERELVAAAVALGAEAVKPWSEHEASLVRRASRVTFDDRLLGKLRGLILKGHDPLGEAFCSLRSAEARRQSGATYTPEAIVRTMVDWARAYPAPARIVDPGMGSARFLMRAGAAFPESELIGIDIDPLATLLARANLAVSGMATRSKILLGDYRTFNNWGFDNDSADNCSFDNGAAGRTLFIGNPPYVRHHEITAEWKDWLFNEAGKAGLTASKLAGLHVHFFLATARYARPGDFGAFITAAEWMDVNYGALVRSLMLGPLGGQSVTVIEPTAQPFPDAATTAAIATFEIGARPTSIFFRRVDSLSNLDGLSKGRRVHRDRLGAEARWSYLTRVSEKPPEGYVELGDLFRVHRGQVTGANEVWIAGEHSVNLPGSVLFRSVTRAKEIFEADGVLDDASKLKFVIDLPIDLDTLDTKERRAVDRFLQVARVMGANKGYIASHRKAWWSVGLREPAPIISTYMARRPPAFVLNKADARHINIAHGLYPREALTERARKTLVDYLQSNISQRSGRTYAGGLTKFEPREMERLIVPGPAMLAAGVVQ